MFSATEPEFVAIANGRNAVLRFAPACDPLAGPPPSSFRSAARASGTNLPFGKLSIYARYASAVSIRSADRQYSASKVEASTEVAVCARASGGAIGPKQATATSSTNTRRIGRGREVTLVNGGRSEQTRNITIRFQRQAAVVHREHRTKQARSREQVAHQHFLLLAPLRAKRSKLLSRIVRVKIGRGQPLRVTRLNLVVLRAESRLRTASTSNKCTSTTHAPMSSKVSVRCRTCPIWSRRR